MYVDYAYIAIYIGKMCEEVEIGRMYDVPMYLLTAAPQQQRSRRTDLRAYVCTYLPTYISTSSGGTKFSNNYRTDQ